MTFRTAALTLLCAGAVLPWRGAVAQVVVEGTVRDTISGNPVQFAIVSVAETGASTLTGRDGRFRLSVAPGRWTLEVRRIGYRMASATVEIVDVGVVGFDVFMRPLPLGLETIQVTAEDEFAAWVIRQAIARKNDVLSRIHDFRYEAYVKMVLKDLGKAEDSADAVVLITETETEAYWERPDKYQEVIRARRQSSNLPAENNLVSVGQIVNFNRDRIDLEKYAVVSPTADDALDHYRYYLMDTLLVSGRKVYRLAIEPRTQSRPLFTGMIDVADSTFDVLSVDVGGNDAIRFAFLENMRYRQRLQDLGDDRWLPYELRLTGEIHLGIPLPGFPQHMSFEHAAQLRGFAFDTRDPPGTLDEFLIVVADGADDVDSTDWESRRPAPLTELERAAYRRIDSLEHQPVPFGRRLLQGTAGALFLTRNPDFFRFNRAEGAYVGAGATLRDLSPDVVLRGRVGRALAAERWQYQGAAQYRLSETQRLWVGASYRDEITRRPAALSATYNPTHLALLARIDPLDYFRERGWTAFVSAKAFDFTQVRLQYTDVAQTSVAVATDFSILDPDRSIRPNPPIADGTLRSWMGTFSFDSRPLLKRGGRDFYLNTITYTRGSVGVEVADPDVVPNDFDFVRVFFRLHRRQRTLNLGLTTIDAYGGTSAGALPPQRYFTLDFGTGDNVGAFGFSTLNEVNFSGNRMAMVWVTHDFDQRIFRNSGLPLVRDLPFTVSIHGGVFWTGFGRDTPFPDDGSVLVAESAYGEIGFGVANLTPMFAPVNLGVYFTWQLSKYDTDNFEIRFGIPPI